MLHAVRLSLVVAAATGCGRIDFTALGDGGGNGQADAGPSGARLKRMWFAYDDGSRSLEGTYDSLLGEPCASYPWNDGSRYCVPGVGAYEVQYLDLACTIPVVAVAPGTANVPAVPYAASDETDSCNVDAFAHLYAGTAPIASATTYVPLPSGGSVTAQTGTFSLYAATELPVSTLVELTISNAPTTGRYAAASSVSADGYTEPYALYDTASGIYCSADDQTQFTVCAPPEFQQTSFVDSGCTNRVVDETSPPGCPPPPYAVYPEKGSCEQDLVAIGAAVATPPQIYQLFAFGTSNMCFSSAVVLTDSFFAPGASSQLPHATHQVGQAPGVRLQNVAAAFDGASTSYPYMYDTTLSTECGPTTAGDGVTRCLPTHNFNLTGDANFTDAMCTQPASTLAAAAASCAPPLPSFAIVTTASGNDVYPLAPSVYTGSLYYLAGTTCNMVATGGATLLDIGAKIDPSAFAAVTIVTDP